MAAKLTARPMTVAAGAVTVPAVLYVYWLGDIIHDQPDRTALIAAIWQHVGYGMLLFPLIVLYLALKPADSPSERPSASNWLSRIFYLNVVLLLITGPLTVWARGSDLKVFSWFAIPSPVEKMPRTYETLEQGHALLAQLFLLTFVLWALSLGLTVLKQHRE